MAAQCWCTIICKRWGGYIAKQICISLYLCIYFYCAFNWIKLTQKLTSSPWHTFNYSSIDSADCLVYICSECVGSYGNGCRENCGACRYNRLCNHITGICWACADGYNFSADSRCHTSKLLVRFTLLILSWTESSEYNFQTNNIKHFLQLLITGRTRAFVSSAR